MESGFIFIYDVRFTNDEYNFLKTNRKSYIFGLSMFKNKLQLPNNIKV